MKKLILSILLCFATLLMRAGVAPEMQHILNETSAGIVLQNGHAYYLSSDNLTLRASAGQSAITVKSGTSAYLFVSGNQVLTCYGGDGDQQIAGGAGIEIEDGANLYVIGSGTIHAYGGKSGHGSRGADGGECTIDSHDKYGGGTGGFGGNGGGGAGAGIGGRGGLGGQGAAETPSQGLKPMEPSNNGYSGTRGNNAFMGNGNNGGNSGQLYVIGAAIINAYPGNNTYGEMTTISANAETKHVNPNSIFGNDYFAGGGGGGGNGANGLAPTWGIGGGGAGASGGGAGSSGAIFNYYSGGFNDLVHFLSSLPAMIVDKVFFQGVPVMAMINQFASDISGWSDYDLLKDNLSGSHGLGAYSQAEKTRYPTYNNENYRKKDYECISGTYTITNEYGGTSGDPGLEGQSRKTKVFGSATVNSYDANRTAQPDATETLVNMPEDVRNVLKTTITFGKKDVGEKGDVIGGTTNVADVCIGEPMPTLDASQFPVHKDDVGQAVPTYTFGGYSDQDGNRWYDENGQPLLHDGVFQEVDPVELQPVWANNVYLLVVHNQETLTSDGNKDKADNFQPFEYDLLSMPVFKDGQKQTQVTFSVAAYQSDDKSQADYSEKVKGYTRPYEKYDYTVTINENSNQFSAATPQILNVNYTRHNHSIVWRLPAQGAVVLDDLFGHKYTHESEAIKYGSTIVPPIYVASGLDNKGIKVVSGWKRYNATDSSNPVLENDGVDGALTDAMIFTLPDYDVVYEPKFEPYDISMNVTSLHGTYTYADSEINEAIEPQANADIRILVMPEEGWTVDGEKGMTVTQYYHGYNDNNDTDKDELYTHTFSVLPVGENQFLVPVGGAHMDVEIHYLPKLTQLWVEQPMIAENVPATRTYVRAGRGAAPSEDQLEQSHPYNTHYQDFVRVYVVQKSNESVLDQSSIIVELKEDKTPVSYRVGFENTTVDGSDYAVPYIEYQAPLAPVSVSYGITTSTTANQLIITAPLGVSVNYGYANTSSLIQIIDGTSRTSFTDETIHNDDVVFLAFSEAVRPRFVDVEGKEVKFDGEFSRVKRTVGGKVYDGYYIHIPANAEGQTYRLDATQNDAEVAELYYLNGKDTTRMVIKRDMNNIALQMKSNDLRLQVPSAYVARPMAEGTTPAADAYLHVALQRQFVANQWIPLYVPFSFNVTAELLDKYAVAKFNQTKMEDGKVVIVFTRMTAGETVEANTPYLLVSKTDGEQTLVLDTKLWGETKATEYISEIEEHGSVVLAGTYDAIAPVTKATELKHPFVMNDGVARYVNDDSDVALPMSYYGLRQINGEPEAIIIRVEEAIHTAMESTMDQRIAAPEKFIRDGQLIIRRDGVEYTAQGVRL